MNSRSQANARAKGHLRIVASFLLQLTVSITFIPSLSPVRGQDKPVSDDTVYIPGQSPEDHKKIAAKPPIEARASQTSSLAPPAHDNFANASSFIQTVSSGFTVTTNVDATGEPGEPLHGAGSGQSGSSQNSVWYSFTATQTRVMRIQTSSAGATPIQDTVLSAYTGSSLSDLTPIAENDDYTGLGLFSKITFGAIAGQTYHIAVDGFSNATGTFSIGHIPSISAVNDDFNGSESITGSFSPFIGITGSTIGATGETGEPNHAGNSGSLNSTWYIWTAPANQSMTFMTVGSTFDTTLSVYTGSAVNALTLVANDDDDGPGISSRVTFIATAGTTYRIAIDGFGSQTGNTLLNWGINWAESSKQFDFDGDRVSDFSVYRPGTNVWYLRKSSDHSFLAVQWGLPGDVLVPGIDYEGDDIADFGIWRPSNGTFYTRRSSNGTMLAGQWGLSSDIPVQGDFDGDDRSDFAVWRPSNGTFYVFRSGPQLPLAFQWGQNGDKPAAGDYDGDGRTDFAVWRPSNGAFYVFRSSNNSFQITTWGLNGDLVVPGDYDNDGKNDMAVYRPSTNVFYALRSSNGALFAVQWGVSGDLVAPGDYDGNGYSDVCVWRPSNGTFYVFRSPAGPPWVFQWGQNGDVPVSHSNVH